ncbi:hypothetical protein BRDCF_p1494 [Bacteroidales bacterium CF]|jgi:hypothetical protein|nr:hypothetical protein BRDCF_p1494 [Bacteroidales bacterium CF]
MDNVAPKNIQMKLLSVEEKRFKSDLDEALSDVINDSNLKFNIGYSLLPNQKNNSIVVEIAAKYLFDERELLYFVASLTFKFSAFDEIFEIKDSKILEKVTVIPTLINVAIGTLRGMVASKTSGTFLRNFPLPLIDPNSLLNKQDN